VGDSGILENLPKVSPKVPFSEDVLEFCNDISKEIRNDSEAKAFPDIVTLGFWLRKSSLMKLKERFSSNDGCYHIGRGIAFHIAPSNVPVNYAYSLFTGLICGNANVVRVPSKDFPQVGIINRLVNKALDKHEGMKPYIVLVKYDRNREINDKLSAMCDARIIWGGDATINELRKSPIPPRATEITFADRYSLAVIDSDEYLRLAKDEKMAERIALDFYNDTYLSDQNACTSPRVVVWTGNSIETAKREFWDGLHEIVKAKYNFQKIQGVDKLSTSYMVASSGVGNIKSSGNRDNLLVRVRVSELTDRLMDYRGNSGFFYEYDCEDILEIRDFCNNTHCQTVGVLGDKDLLRPLFESGIKGIDRVVPIGHTMDFDFIWDGYNLVERLTRTVEL
jgi:hypothetical protein